MKNSKRPMSERHGPHDQNKTPHDGGDPEGILQQSGVSSQGLVSTNLHKSICEDECGFVDTPIPKHFLCIPKWIGLYQQLEGAVTDGNI